MVCLFLILFFAATTPHRMPHTKPLVALVGRPNVGKSTLFNRLVGRRDAIMDAAAGTTRDRLYGDVEWQGRALTLIDTGGLVDRAGDHLSVAINEQVTEAVRQADLVVLVVDAAAGVTAGDEAVAGVVRRAGKEVLLIGNKADNLQVTAAGSELFALGAGPPILVSALHGRATGDLLDELVNRTSSTAAAVSEEVAYPRVALIGRANVGKSTLFNRFSSGPQRISSAEPHTTRDVGGAVVETEVGPIELLDTAGMLRRGKSGRGIPKFSLLRTLRAISEAQVVCLLIDAVEGPTVQDAHIASYAMDAGAAIVIVVNKWDLVEKAPDVQEQFYAELQARLGFLPSPPVVFTSALTGEKAANLPRAIYDVWTLASTKIETPELNQTLRGALPKLPAGGGRHAPKLYYATQVGTHPPTFLLFVNRADAWGNNHRRYLMNVLRDTHGLLATPIVLKFRAKPPREAAP